MSGTRDISDYPEHLNPFHEDTFSERMRFWTIGRKGRSNSFSSSLKDFKKSVRQSFRGKKESKHAAERDDVTIRIGTDSMNGRQTHTMMEYVPQRNPAPSPALPRSRFSERVVPQANKYNVDGNSPKLDASENSFRVDAPERKSKLENGAERGRRRKKKAPPPPLLANQTINEESGAGLDVPHSNSKWSLTSTETEISMNSSYSAGENANEALQNLTRDIEKLTDDTNSENVATERNAPPVSSGDKNEIPDLVISCENKEGDGDCEENPKDRAGDGNNNVEETKENPEDDNNNTHEDPDGRREREEENNNNDIMNGSTDTPTPKVRKNKVTKTTMLGKEVESNDA